MLSHLMRKMFICGEPPHTESSFQFAIVKDKNNKMMMISSSVARRYSLLRRAAGIACPDTLVVTSLTEARFFRHSNLYTK